MRLGKFLLAMGALIMADAPAHCALSVLETQVTNSIYDQVGPDVYGNSIVWEDYRDEDDNGSDLWRFDIAQQLESPLVQSQGDQFYPAIWGNNVVYLDNSNPATGGPFASDVWRAVIGGSSSALTSSFDDEYAPAIFGDRTVFERDAGSGNWNIDSYILSSGPGPSIASSPLWEQFAATGGNYTVFSRFNGSDWDLYGYNHSTSAEFPISLNVGDQWYARTDGRTVVWEDTRNLTGPDIYMYDLLTGVETPVCALAGSQVTPDVRGQYIVWADKRDGVRKIRLYDLNTGIDQLISQNASGYASWPRISGNRVVWQDGRNGNDDIYMALVGPAYQQYASIGNVRELADGTGVSIDGRIVTRAWNGMFAISDADRASGILVNGNWGLAAGDVVSVAGYISSTSAGERIIMPSEVTKTSSVTPLNALRMINSTVGGGTPVVDLPGITGGVGVNNVGSFVCVWGTVKSTDIGVFYISDGSKVNDGVGPIGGLRIECPGIIPPPVNAFVQVRGISRLFLNAGARHRMVFVTSAPDIVSF